MPATSDKRAPRANTRAKVRPRAAVFCPEPGVSIEPGDGVAWYIIPAELPRGLHKGWADATGGNELPVDRELLSSFRESAAEVCDDRWRLVEAISGPDDPVLVWVVLMHPALSKKQRQQAWDDLVTWSGIRVESALSGDGWEAIDGDPYGTMDAGLIAHQLRYYPEQGVVVHAAGEREAAVERVLAGIRVTGRAPAAGAAPAERQRTFDSLLAPETARGVKDCPGPACRDIQRLAASLKSPDILFTGELTGGGSVRLALIEGGGEPSWEPSFDSNPPGGGHLSECIDWMREQLAGRAVEKVTRVRLRRPRGDAEIEKVAGERFAEAMREIATSKPDPAPKKRVRARR
jgi:hypothetical protein